jgi:deoxyribodipyrimidine photo-lyase
MRTALCLFTRDLRVHDNPALAAAAAQAETVVPLFVLDDEILCRFGAPARVAFLLQSLHDLDRSLRERGSALVVRRGRTVAAVVGLAGEVGAGAVFLAEDVSATAARRESALREAGVGAGLEVRTFPGVTVVPPGDLAPSGAAGPFRVFTAYWNRWRMVTRRTVLEAPAALRPCPVEPGPIPDVADLAAGAPAAVPPGGETPGRNRLERWLEKGLASYEEGRDDLAGGGTSGLSPYLHLGCLSPLEVVERAWPLPGGEPFVRQLCWRDFHHQLLAANPALARDDLRPRGDRWRDDPEGLAAWRAGLTGYPLVDAGMRQLAAEGTMHNRVRLVTASFLTKHLYVDWRLGAEHFAAHLVDGDVANNALNWQWVAGTGADTRPNRVFNPTRQAHRYDPSGDYVRRWVPELASLDGGLVHEPWCAGVLRPAGYPEPLVDHDEAVARFRGLRLGR